MVRVNRLFTMLLLVVLLLSACQPIVAPKAMAPSGATEPGEGQNTIEVTAQSAYGSFNNIDYIRYEGRFISTTPSAGYNAPFEIVAPKDPQQGNRRLLFEPYHFVGGAGSRDFLTPQFLFEQGFSHAAVCWETPAVEEHPCQTYVGDKGVELQLIANFARFLKGTEAAKMVGSLEHLYSMGFSDEADVLHPLLLDPLGQNLFDLSFVLTTGWPHPILENQFKPRPELSESLIPSETAGRVIVLQTEADLILWNGALLRDETLHPYYRLYEIAGGAHIPGEPLDWTPVLSALFVAGDRWVTEGAEPPPSTLLDSAASGEIDPVYERETWIARDADGNARGGVRLPDLALGSKQCIAVDMSGDFPLVGVSHALQCEPRADGSVRFADHATYLSQFQQELDRLLGEGFLLPTDAEAMFKVASESDIGEPNACP